MMESIKSFINYIEKINDVYPACFSLIAGILITVFFSWLFHIIFKKSIKICYFCYHNNIVSNYNNIVDFLTIRFKKQKIDNFSITKFIIFNSGNEALKNTDLASSDLFGFKITDGEFLDAQIIEVNDKVSEAAVSFDDKQTIRINFHHINPEGVLVIQICHTSKQSKNIKLYCSGAGVYKVKRIKPYLASKRLRVFLGLSLIAYILLFFCMFFKIETVTDLMVCKKESLTSALYTTGAAILILFMQFLSAMGYTWKWRYWGRIAVKNNFWDEHNDKD